MNIWGNHRKCQQQLIPLHIKSFRARALHNIPLIRAARKDNTYQLVIEKDIYTTDIVVHQNMLHRHSS